MAAATQTLQRYKAGKAALDRRLVDNELWFRMGHWKNYQNPMMPGKAQPSSGWLFNSIANKHADAMDNYPEPMCCPVQRTMRQPRGHFQRAAGGAGTGRLRAGVQRLLVAQAQAGHRGHRCVLGPGSPGRRGEIAVRAMNLLMLYWEPGVADIQDSPDFSA